MPAIDLSVERKALVDWVRSVTGFDANHVLWADQDAPRPTLPYALLKILTFVKVGMDENRLRDDDVEVDIVGQREMTISLNTLGVSAFENMAALQNSLCLDAVRELFNAANLAYASDTGPTDISQLLETVIEPRAQMDIVFHHAQVTTEDQGRIEEVELGGIVDGHTVSEVIDSTP